ncbi:MBL fold metallo-hydrolase [Pontibacter sp. Tf4]|uniref:MBL fold metallo-hydrolase n=1 Tax=Pontibacter sp. Tf4 TaxID=2761620 RepID=UPI001629D527|nr:MBL fold metallo-hydrolase [Pontibacter sp. Tf4]MBB6612463.1 MBL fold metallo-hydrolase [Pontibacter sp. Tf4]
METTERHSQTGRKHSFPVAPGVWGLKTIFVNLYFVAEPDGSWVLVDTGVYGAAPKIKEAAAELFGHGNKPRCILLTHGHFDHIGAVKELASEWDVPVYAHPLELPYLTGRSAYPPPDPSVGGGGMAYMSFLYPKKPIDITSYVELLPEDGSVPGLPGWHWLHTPGHTAGHVSFFREQDRVLLAGDAFITRHGESVMAVMTQKKHVYGPPKYYTSDWAEAYRSVEKLADLNPAVAATGHGMPMRGPNMQFQLEDLVRNFWEVAVPTHGRYVQAPAITDEAGVVSVPPAPSNSVPKVMLAAGVVALAGAAILTMRSKNNKKRTDNLQGINRPYSHNRPVSDTAPATGADHDGPEHTNNYP